MSLAIDLRWWHESLTLGRPNGISRHCEGLIEALLQARDGREFILLGSERGDTDLLSRWQGQARFLKGPATWLCRQRTPWPLAVVFQMRRDAVLLPDILARAGARLYHSPSQFLPPPRLDACKTVCTVHDLSYLRFPEELTPRSVTRWAFRRLLAQVASADLVIAVSQATARDVIHFLDLPPSRVRLVLNGLDAQFIAAAKEAAPARREEDHFLFVGGARGRAAPVKNLQGLLGAYGILRRERGGAVPPLVVVGDTPDDAVSEGVRRPGRVDDTELRTLYRKALAVVVPSLWEGFGYPALEAMAMGAPVVASTAAAIREVTGDLALYAEARDAPAMARAMERILVDSDLRRSLGARGRERALGFSWEASARRLITYYDELLSAPVKPEPAAPALEARIPPDQEDYWTRYFASSRARSHIGRRRLQEVLATAGELNERSVLDVGCGAGLSTAAIALAGAVRPVGLDLSPDLPRRGPRIAAHNRVRAAFVRGDATRLPFEGRGFDLVLSMEMIEHIPDWESAIREMARCVRPGGRLLVSTPNKWGIHHVAKVMANRLRLHPPGHAYTYERFLSRRQILRALRDEGLELARGRTALFMMPFVPEALYAAACAIERCLETIPWVRGLGVTNIYVAGRRP